MFYVDRKQTRLSGAGRILPLIYYATVAKVRKSHGNPIIGLIMEILQTVIFIAAFWLMFEVLGLRGSAIRGDFMLFLLSGIFLFFTHNKAVSAVFGAEGPTSPMMKHAPMNTIVAIAASALSTLYLQLLSLFVVMFFIHTLYNPIYIVDPTSAALMLGLAWLSGIAVGLVFLAAKPWAPQLIGVLNSIYSRLNMVASGKMFVANALPSSMYAFFSWNPLFHAIDQARGYTFINYDPRYTSWEYPLYLSITLILIGLMGEFFTRRHVSASWSAGK